MEKLYQRTAKAFLKNNSQRGEKTIKASGIKRDFTGGKTGKLTSGREYVCVYLLEYITGCKQKEKKKKTQDQWKTKEETISQMKLENRLFK